MRWRLLKLDWKYAIGELIIVTAGVLIALAIDQWNSDRLDRVEEAQIVGRLIADLRTDLEGYASGSRILETKDAALARVRAAIMDVNERSYDAPSLLTDLIESSNFGWNQPRALRATFDELLSSGRFGLIRSAELRAQISAYYDSDEGSARRIEERETAYPSLTYELAPRVNEFELDPAIDSTELEQLARGALERNLRGLVIAETNFSRFVRQRFVVLEAECNELIEALGGYLDEIN